jgi:hypothetical protein
MSTCSAGKVLAVAATLAALQFSPDASAGSAVAVERWREMLAVPGTASPPLIADLDGDGVAEIVTPRRQLLPSFVEATTLYVHRAGDDVERVLVDSYFLGRSGEVHVLERPGADALVTITIEYVGNDQLQWLTVLSGVPLSVESRQTRGWTQMLHVGDVDADGSTDVLEHGGDPVSGLPSLRLVGLFDQMVRWSVPVSFRPVLSVGQLDADAALEVVQDQGGATVIDGATGLTDWAAPGSLRLAHIADVWAASPGNELVAVENNLVRVRAGGSFSLLTEFSGACCWPRDVADLDLDGTAELVLFDFDDVRIFDLDDQTERLLSLQSDFGSRHWLHDVDDDPAPEIVAFDQNATIGMPVVSVVDATTGQRESLMRGAAEQPFAVASGDLDGDGAAELVSILLSNVDGQARLEIRDAANGALLRATPIPRLQSSTERSTATSNIVLAQMDADAALEIVFSHYGSSIHRLAVLDGVTLEIQWSRVPRDEAQSPILFEHIAVADVDAGGSNELLAISQESRVHVLDALTGLTRWRSPDLGEGYFLHVAAAQLDADAALEIMAWTGDVLRAYDGVTHALDRQRSFEEGGKFFVRSIGRRCLFGVVASWRQTLFDCTDTSVARPFDLGNVQSIGGIEPLPGWNSGYVAVIDRELVHLDRAGSQRTTIGPEVAELLAGSASAGIAVSPSTDGAMRVVLGTDATLSALDLVTDQLFDDSFE